MKLLPVRWKPFEKRLTKPFWKSCIQKVRDRKNNSLCQNETYSQCKRSIPTQHELPDLTRVNLHLHLPNQVVNTAG